MAWRIGGLAAGLMAGIVAAAQDVQLATAGLWSLAVAGAALTAANLLSEWRWRPWPPLTLAAAAFACALPLGYLRTMDVVGPPTEGSLRYILRDVEDGTRLGVRGTIAAEPEIRGSGELDLDIRVHALQLGEDAPWTPVRRGRLLTRVYVRATHAAASRELFNRLASPAAYGWSLELSSTYQHIESPLNPGTFDYARFLRQSGMDTRLRTHVSRVDVREESRGNFLTELALAAKMSFLETFRDTIRSPASRLTAAATLGARRSVEHVTFRERDLATVLRHAGVGHVLAVSGLHVSVIAVMLFALFRMTGAKPKGFVPFLILFLILFAVLTGARPSSVRAVIMNSVILIAIAYLRCNIRSATAIGLSLSAFFILMRNPTVLFAPSFLLSYGAVLSLIVIAPPLDRLICLLRGFTLLFAMIWFAGVLRLAGWHLPWIIQPPNLMAVLGALWLAIWAGTRLNQRWPRMWAFNLERIPTVVRIFFAAQLAIQLGMMIPMSAWFFGQLPVAGVLVNLLAIPGVGILVQLGMLTGLVGLLPWMGGWLAIPFGAATTLAGDFFIWLAYIGASVFPYPATPLPTGWWMFGYYTGLAVFILLEGQRNRVWGWIYRGVPPGPSGPVRKWALVIPALLLLWPVAHQWRAEPELRQIRVLADGRYPIVVFTGQDTAALLNAGSRFVGGRLVFDSLRAQGATQVDTILLPGADPRAGTGGAAALMDRMPVQQILVGTLPEPGQSLPAALGDQYLMDQVAEGTFWAVNIDEGFETLRRVATEEGVSLKELTDETLPRWRNARFQRLPAPAQTPSRFASSALTPVLFAEIHGLEWLFITETTPDALFDALAETTTADVLVVPNLSTFRTYHQWLRTAVRRTSPRVLIIAGDEPIPVDDLQDGLPPDPARTLIQTGQEGAVMVRLRGRDETRFETYRGATRVSLRPQE